MTREEAIKTLADIGAVFAEEMGCTEIEEEEAYFGIWEEIRKVMTERYGEMKTTIISNGSVSPIDGRRDLYVELGFRFGNPRLEVFGRNENGRQTLAGMELSDTVWNDKVYEHPGDYKYRESQVWDMEGFETLGRMLRMWKERGGE